MRLPAVVLLLGLSAVPLSAQEPGDDATRALELRQRIEERFAARVREDLGLSDQQASKMRETVGGYFAKRRALEADERRYREVLGAQLRPGVAANRDSVSRLVEAMAELKVRYAETYKAELRDLSSFLDPVQRAQFFLMRERLLENVRRARELRRDEDGVPPRRRLRP